MDILSILKTVGEHWALFVGVFGLGAAWWQGKMWFKNLNNKIEVCIEQHELSAATMDQLSDKLDSLDQKMEVLDDRISRLEDTVELMHSEIREQEVKLTVLEHITDLSKNRASAR